MIPNVLPLWFRLLVGFDFTLAILIGGIGTFVLAAMIPYGHPQPDAMTVIARYVGTFLLAPVLVIVIVACAVLGSKLLKAEMSVPAFQVVAAPALVAPWVWLESIA